MARMHGRYTLACQGRNHGGPWGRVSKSSGFLPTQLSGLIFWLRADLGITLNSGNVSAWADQSGTGDVNKNATQGTAANQPLWTAANASYNNQPTVTYGSSHADGEWLATGTWSVALAQPFTRFLVGNTVSSGTNNYFTDSLSAGTQSAIFSSVASNNWAGFDGTQINCPTPQPTTPTILATSDNGASSKLYRSALTQVASGNLGASGATGLTNGNYAGHGNFSCKGPIAEMVIYNRTLSAGEFATVMNYLGTRYGISVGA